ncbi:hypothetical protein E4U35_005477 [Claviceps purpurea]|nr:hypothetical protein E4U35_005477 [Claviceps purpurea]KAG6265144.1 hypothetical protein E4U48_006067 [Claviceps purpurea]
MVVIRFIPYQSRSRYSTVLAPAVGYEIIDEVEDISQYKLAIIRSILTIGFANDIEWYTSSAMAHSPRLAVNERTTKYVAIKVSTSNADRKDVDILPQMAQSAELCDEQQSLAKSD